MRGARARRGAPPGRSPSDAAAHSAAGTPTANAIAAAARKLATWCGPATGRWTAASPSGVARRNRLPSGSATTSFAVTSASPERPNRTTRPRCRAAIAATRGSSAFATNVPPGFNPSRISALPSAIASSDAKN